MFSMLQRERGVTLVIGTLLMVGCGGGGDAGSDTADAGAEAAPAEATSSVDAATAGNIAGLISFAGDAPARQAIDMAEESVCADKHATEPMTETVLVGEGGGLANVFVYVKEGLEGQSFTAGAAAVIDQEGCVYAPHVLGVMAGQDITIRNSDGVLHNINASPTENRPFNVSQPVEMETNRSFRVAEVMIPLRCDVHGWMSAYIGVLDHPYHSVSTDAGAFSLETLPPGDYVIEAWHEEYGTLQQSVTVTTGETTEITFEFSESMAGADVPLGEAWTLSHAEHGTHGDEPDAP